jgi:hypothetical protein
MDLLLQITHDLNDVDQLQEMTSLLIQSMVDLKDKSLLLLQFCFANIVQKYFLFFELHEKNYFFDVNNNSNINNSENNNDVVVDEEMMKVLPHVEMEQIALQKQYLLFVQNIAMQQHCQVVFFENFQHLNILNQIFTHVSFILQNNGNLFYKKKTLNGIEKNDNFYDEKNYKFLTLKKCCISIMIGLTNTFFYEKTVVDFKNNEVLFNLKNNFHNFLLDTIMPTVFFSCFKLNFQNPLVQTFIIETAVLVVTIKNSQMFERNESLVHYFQSLLINIGFNNNHNNNNDGQNNSGGVDVFLKDLKTDLTVGSYKEVFKAFVKNYKNNIT